LWIALLNTRLLSCSENPVDLSPQPEPPLLAPAEALAFPVAGGERGVVLRTTGLKKHFGRMLALDGVDLTVREGEIYGFLGRNGAGKTTTIRALIGILAPDEGEMELLGRSVRRVDVKTKQRIGYVSQEPHCYPWMSARALGDFVAGFYPTWDGAEYDRLLRSLDLPPDRRFSQLSGGMQMKLALALALAHRPALLILDEPTAGLDPVARREFLELIASQARNHGRTTFFSTHLIDEVERVADRVGIIDRGRMRYEGSVADLRAEVKRVHAEPAGTPPVPGPEFQLLRDESVGGASMLVFRAPAAAWTAAQFGPTFRVEEMSLEDIFLAFAAAARVQL
jgi:ABC-2 type transport system ATP-binding protein